MGGWSGIGVGIGQSGSDIARGILEAREAKRQRETQATELQMRTAKRAVGEARFGADGKWRQIFEYPMTGQRTVEEVVGLPAPPPEYKGSAIDPNNGDLITIRIPATGGPPIFDRPISAVTPEKFEAEAYSLIEGIEDEKVRAAAKRSVDSAIKLAKAGLGEYKDAYDIAQKALDSFRQSTQITSRVGVRAEYERKLRAEEAPGLVVQGILTAQEAQAYIAFGKSAVPRVYQTVGTEMQQRVNEITGLLETAPVQIYRTTTSGIPTGGRVAAPAAGRGAVPPAGGVQPPRRVTPLPAPNRQIRYPEPVRAELDRLDKVINTADQKIMELSETPMKDKIGMPDVAATNTRITELTQTILNARIARNTATSKYTPIIASEIDLTKPLDLHGTLPNAVGRTVDLGYFAALDREQLRTLSVDTVFNDKRDSTQWRKISETTFQRVR